MKYFLSNTAFNDLEAIWQYTFDTWSIKQANEYYNFIIASILLLCLNPKKGRPISEVRIGYRKLKIKSHLLIYKIEEEQIFVVRILHERMDISTHLC
jgi:toxin ParE1/3/4